MFGNDLGYMRPGATISRAEVATILVRTELRDFATSTNILPPDMSSFTAFSDVTPNNWFFFYVAWAYDAGLVRGNEGRFRPNDPVTRQELAAMIARLGTVYPAGESSFPDADTASAWAAGYIYTVYRNGLMLGNQYGLFHPQRNITRAETATVVNRNLGRIASHAEMNAADVAGILNIRHFPDLSPSPWYWPSMIMAANNHYLSRDSAGVANWIRIPPQ